MSVKIERKTALDKLFKCISVTDSAINWEKSYSDLQLTDDKKKERYVKSHSLDSISFIAEDKPTVFVFKHPHRAEIKKEVRSLYTKISEDKKESIDLFSEVIHLAFLGTQDGLDGALVEVPRGLENKITDDYIQAIEDADILIEIAMALVKAGDNKKDDGISLKK